MSYLEHCSPEKFEIVAQAQKIFKSFEHTHFFFKDYQVGILSLNALIEVISRIRTLHFQHGWISIGFNIL